MTTLETQRLILRPVTIEDVPAIYSYSKDADVAYGGGWAPHRSPEESREIAKAIFIEQPDIFGIVIRDTGEFIGIIGLVEDKKRENPACRMIGYSISKDHWNRGYTTEAVYAMVQYGFAHCGYALLSAYCYSFNLASKRVLSKCGFVYEGTLTQAEVLFNGEIADEDCFKIELSDLEDFLA